MENLRFNVFLKKKHANLVIYQHRGNNTVNYRHFAHAHNNAHPPKIPKYRSKILYLTYGRYNAHPLKIQFLNLQAHGRYGGRLRYIYIKRENCTRRTRSPPIEYTVNDRLSAHGLLNWEIEFSGDGRYSEHRKCTVSLIDILGF